MSSYIILFFVVIIVVIVNLILVLFYCQDDGPANGTFEANEQRGGVYSVSSSNFRKPPPTEEIGTTEWLLL